MLLGVALFGYLVYQVGLTALANQLRQIGWWFAPICCIALVWFMCTALAWRIILDAFGYRLPFAYLLRLKFVAESVNVIVPTANIGGEGARAYMVKKHIPGEVAVVSVILDKTMDNLGKMVFTLAGVAASLFFVPIPPDWTVGIIGGLALIVGFNAATVIVQFAGVFDKTLPLASRMPWLGERIKAKHDQIRNLDGYLKSAYTQKRDALVRSLLWHVARRLLNVVEVWLIFWLLTGNGALHNPLFITSMTTAVGNAFVLIPGKWGVIEGVQVLLTEFIGYSAAVGIGIGVTRRIRSLLFTAIGLLLLRFRR